MKRARFVLSLTTRDSDYQAEQAAAAEEAARRLGIDLQVLYAENDTIEQSQQLLNIIQSDSGARPDGIIFEPVGGTGLPQVARAAVSAGIGWVVLNREVDYVAELRRSFKVPIFAVTSDHEEIGRIQGRQIETLLSRGGSILLIHGPTANLDAKQRTIGMYETKPARVQVKQIRGDWTEAGAYKSVSSWLELSTSREARIDLIAAQNDVMAMGARKAFQGMADNALRERWLALPYLGVDGIPKTGQTWVRRGQLTATVVVPPDAGMAIEILAHAVQTASMPPEKSLAIPKSFPSIEDLAKTMPRKSRAAAT
jgi:ribose transport system substrate-binding protein